MTAVAVLLAIFSVPLAAIVSSTYLKAKRINAEKADAEVRRKVRDLEAVSAELRERIENLETIVTTDPFAELDPDSPQRPALTEGDPDAVDLKASLGVEEVVR